MKKIKTFDGGIVDKPFPNWKDFYTCMNYKTGYIFNANTPAKAAKLAGFEVYCLRHEHRCEGKGCNKLTTYKYCPSCHFDDGKNTDKKVLGFLGM